MRFGVCRRSPTARLGRPRGTGRSRCRWTCCAPHPAQLDDLKTALGSLRDNARSYGIDPFRIGVWGDSAGGHLCALLGVAEPGTVQDVIARSAPGDLSSLDVSAIDNEAVLGSLVGGAPDEHRSTLRQLSPRLQVHPAVPPFLIVHGTDDEIVPLANAEALVNALRGHGADVTFEVIPGGRHGLRTDTAPPTDNTMWAQLGRQAVDFFTKHLS